MKQLNDISGKVKEMHELLTQAKGVRWAVLAMAGVGGFVAAKLTTVAQWFSSLPR